MQLRRSAILMLLPLALAAGPAQAGICTLLVLTPGTLALSPDGTRLGSTETGGIAATMTVTSIGSSTLTVGAPAVIQAPAGHATGSDLVEVAYVGAGLLAGANQSYTAAQTAVAVPNIVSAVVLTINNRITNMTGFKAGTYQTRTVVTCS
jgi:hypothetical protein